MTYLAKIYTKDEAIDLKKQAFKKLNNLLETLIAKPSPQRNTDIDYTKKAALISKWIRQYSNYISFEENYDPTKNISYQRGDIVFVNFGFGVGSEFGGNHYAVVMDKDNKHNASSVTVIPLSSYKPNKGVYERDVYLGNELYEKLLQKRSEKFAQSISDITIEPNPVKSGEEFTVSMKIDTRETDAIQATIDLIKEGSVAKIEQIRSISKMRIYNPKNSQDTLYGIRFSDSTMDKIDEKLRELYIFN